MTGLGVVVFAVLAPVALLAQSRTAGPPPHEGTIDVGDARIFYRDTGVSGIPVVFLHAATGSSDVWEKQIPALTAAGFRVIAFDRRGWGRSTTGSQPGTAAGDLLSLLDHLGIQQAHVVGSAAGGCGALAFP